MIAFDVMLAYFHYKDENLIDIVKSRAPYGMYQVPDYIPQRETSRMGHSYARHHHLTRNGTMILVSRYSPLLVPFALAGSNIAMIHNAPEEQQKGFWQMFASGLTGTIGIGSGLKL